MGKKESEKIQNVGMLLLDNSIDKKKNTDFVYYVKKSPKFGMSFANVSINKIQNFC